MQEKNNFLVTICIPAYNRPKYLEMSIRSLILQTYKNIEIIVSDDASQVNLEYIVKNFNDSRIKFFRHQNNLGFIKNWNFCLSKSNGEYIKIMGDDDVLLPSCIEKSLKIMQNKKADFLCSNYYTINECDEIINNSDFNLNSFRLLQKSEFINEDSYLRRYFMRELRIGLPSAIMFTKKALLKTGVFDERAGCAADADMWIRMINNFKLYYHDNVLLKMRRHQNNLSDVLNKDFFSVKDDLFLFFQYYPRIKNSLRIKEKIIIFLKYLIIILKDSLDMRIFKKQNFILYRKEIKRFLKAF